MEMDLRNAQLNNAENFNKKIKALKDDGLLLTEDISDGYHTIGELYDHRIALYLALCKQLNHYPERRVWKSKLHHDGTMFDGMFIVGIGFEPGAQISYHMNMEWWDKTDFIEELEKAPEYDGHTSNDVLERLLKL